GMQEDSFDPSLRGGTNPSDVLGYESAKAPHLEEQGTPLDRVNPDRGALHARRGRLEARQAERNQPDKGETDDSVDRPANSLAPTIGRSSDIQRQSPIWCGPSSHLSVKFTVTVITTGTGLPFSNVGVNSHWRTASRAAASRSG